MDADPPMDTVKDVVTALGGRRAVADLCQVTYTAVSNWCSWNAFPKRLHYVLFRECQGRGIKLAGEFFDQHSSAEDRPEPQTSGSAAS